MVSRLKLQDELQRRIKANPSEWYTPTGKQADYIAKVGCGKYRICILSGANRPGKSRTGFHILDNIINEPQSKWFQYPLFQNWPYPKKGRIGSTAKNLTPEIGAVDRGIQDCWKKGSYRGEKQGKHYNALYRCANGWIVDVMSYEQALTEWESVQLGFVYFDEPPPISVFNASLARMEKGGIVFIHMTPLSMAADIFDAIENMDNVLITYMDIEDSCIQHGIRGFIEHSEIEKMISTYDVEEVEARARGKPLFLSRLIYSMLNEHIHRIDDFVIPSDWTRLHIVDPHDALPFCMGWIGIDKTNNYYVYDEYPSAPIEDIHRTNLTFVDYATIIRNKEGRMIAHKRIMDPNFGNKRYANTGLSVKDELIKLGFNFNTDVNDDLTIGHHLVREKLSYNTTLPIDAINHPKLYIMKRCRNHWMSMSRYGRLPTKSSNPDAVKLEEKWKHFCDLIRYAIVSQATYNEPLKERGKIFEEGNMPGSRREIFKPKTANTKYSGGW